jgi:hypothetical protein
MQGKATHCKSIECAGRWDLEGKGALTHGLWCVDSFAPSAEDGMTYPLPFSIFLLLSKSLPKFFDAMQPHPHEQF